jgi:hypothetical protein
VGLRAAHFPLKWTHVIGKESLKTEKLEQVLFKKGSQLCLGLAVAEADVAAMRTGDVTLNLNYY